MTILFCQTQRHWIIYGRVKWAMKEPGAFPKYYYKKTLCDLQLSLSISERREQVQLDPGLCAEAVFQVLGFILHRRQRWHQNLCVLLIFLIFMQLLEEAESNDLMHVRNAKDNEWGINISSLELWAPALWFDPLSPWCPAWASCTPSPALKSSSSETRCTHLY